MPKRQVKHPDRAASTGAYSDGVILDGWLYISGQSPLDLKTGLVVSGSIEEETRRAMSNIGAGAATAASDRLSATPGASGS